MILTSNLPTILLVGQAPGPRHPRAHPATQSHVRLARLVGVTPAVLAARAAWVNVLPTFPGARPGGDAFPRVLARQAAQDFPLMATTLLLGQQVARAFSLPPCYFLWQNFRGCRVAVVPHPSGRNRYWNDPARVAHAAAFLRTALGLDAEP